MKWVCDRCGKEQGKCIHQFDTDYKLQPQERYLTEKLLCDLILFVLFGLIVSFVVYAAWMW